MKILECMKIDDENHDNIKFIRIDPEDLSITIRHILDSLSNMSWILKFDKEFTARSYEHRVSKTVDYIMDMFKKDGDSQLTSNTGEYVVSELARQALVKKLDYLDIPLAELFKEKVVGNPGFDFYSANERSVIVFGEAKYIKKGNAYGRAMEQVNRFIKEGQDISDLNDIDKFFSDESLNKVANGEKAFAIAFSSTNINSDDLINNIKNNKHYHHLSPYDEVIYLAVDVCKI